MAVPHRAVSPSDSPLQGGIYWIRVISFAPAPLIPTLIFDDGKPIPVTTFLAWETKSPWKRILMTGSMEVEYSDSPCMPFPGAISPATAPEVNSDRSSFFILLGTVVPATFHNWLNLSAGTKTIRLRRIVILQPGTTNIGALDEFEIHRTTTAIVGGVNPVIGNNDTNDAPFTGNAKTDTTGPTGSAFVDRFALYVPPNLGPFDPIIYEFNAPDSKPIVIQPDLTGATFPGISLFDSFIGQGSGITFINFPMIRLDFTEEDK